jgi:hypothetical protein
MKKNVGTVDQVIRILIAVIVSVLFFTHVVTGTVAVILLVLSGVLLLTSVFGFCPLYALTGLRTKK